MRKIYALPLISGFKIIAKKSRFVFIILLATLFAQKGLGQTILAWDFTGDGTQTTVTSTFNNANLNGSTIGKGSGLANPAGANAFPGSFGAVGYTTGTTSLATAVSALEYLEFTVSVKTGYKVSLSTLDANFLRSTNNAPNSFQWQYSLNAFATAGVNIGTTITYNSYTTGTAPNGTAQTQINLSGIPALQNVDASTNITIRIYGWGAANTGSTFALGKLTGNDLAIGGTVVALPPAVSGFSPTSGCAGTTSVVISGSGFTGATAVTFGGTAAASFTVNNSGQITATPGAGTTGVIQITTPGGNGSSAASFTVNQSATITLGGTASQTVCAGTAITAITYTVAGGGTGASLTSGSFPTGITGTLSGKVFTISGTPNTTVSGSFPYTITSSGSSCTNPALSGIITVNGLPAVTIQPSTATQAICKNGTATALTVAGSGTGVAYQWYSNTTASNGSGTIIPGATLSSYTPLTTTVGTLYYYCLISGTCTPSVLTNVSGPIIINAPPAAGAITGATGTCIGSTVTLTSNATGTGPFTYTWSSSNTAVATITNAGNITGVAAGTTSITYTATDANGCTATSATYAFGITPTAGAITGAAGSCAGNTVNLVSHATGVGTLTYIWSSSNNSVATITNAGVVTPIATGTTNITYTVTDGNTCTATSANFAFAVTQPIANAITGAANVCAGSNITLVAHATGAATLTYTWASSNTATATITNAGIGTGVAAGTSNITYTVTDGNGCTATSGIYTITVNAKPIAGAITGGNTVCISSTDNLASNATGASPFTYTWVSSNTASVTINTSGVATGVASGTSNISYTVTDANTCSATSALFALTVTKPAAGTITGASKACIGNSVTLSSPGSGVAPLTYTWASSNTATATVTNAGVVTAVAAGTTNITYTVTDGNGCSNTSANFVFTVTQPIANTITGATSVCAGSNITLVSHATGAATLTYTWASSNTAFATITNAGVVTGVGAGTSDITYTVTDGNGCTATSAVYTITVNTKPIAGAITGGNTVCISSTDNLASNATGASPFTYAWASSNAGAVTVNTSGVATGVAAGTSNISYTVTDANTCSATSALFAVTVTKPTAGTITGTSKVCIGNTITLGSPGAGVAPLSYTWASSNTATATVTNAGVVTGVAAGTTNITYTVTDGNGCSTTSATFLVTVTIPTAGAITGASAVCIGSGTTTLVSHATGTATLTYTWASSNTGTATISSSGVVTSVAAGTTNITYTVTDGNGCSATSATFLFTVNAKPLAGAITGASTVCRLSTTTLTPIATGAGTLSYTWASSNTGVATVSGTGVVTGAGNGTANITYTVTDANTCSSTSATFAITVTKPTAGNITGASKVCVGNNITLASNATGTGPFSYTWASSNTAAATVTNAGVVTGVANGTTNITYTVTDPNSCSTTSNTFSVLVSLPVANAITGATAVCVGNTISLVSHATGTATLTYTWASSNTAVATVSGTGVVTGVSGGTANITYTVTDGNGCPVTSPAYAITVNPKPTAGAITGASTVCIASQITLVSHPGGTAPFTYTWASSNTGVVTVTAAGVVTGVGTGTSNITYTVTDANGCSSTSATFAVTVTKPTAGAITQASGLSIVCMASTLPLTSNATGTATLTYTWASSNNAVATVNSSGVVTGVTAGTTNITYTVTDGNGCSTTSAAYAITVNQTPVGTLSATETSGTTSNDNIICTGATVKFTATSGYNAYVFKVNGTTVQSGTAVIYNSSTLSNGASVTVDVSNGLNCGSTFGPIVITVNPLPVATLSADRTTACAGTVINFTAGGGNNYTFKVNGSGVQSSSSNLYSTGGLNNGDVVTVDVTNANGCLATSPSQTITINPLPTGRITASATEVCSGGPVTFTATAGFNTYEFFVNGTSQGAGTTATFTGNFTNPSVITVVATNTATGCSAVLDTASVNVNALPSGTLSATENSGVADDNSICAGAPVNFLATAGFANYDFQVNGVSKQSSSSNTYSNATFANGDVVAVVASSGSSCSATFNPIMITVVPSPSGTLTASPSSTICIGDNVVFTATAGFANYNFKINGATVQNGAGNSFSSTGLANGNVVSVDVTNTNSCIATFNTITVTVNALPTASLAVTENSGNAANDAIICTRALVTFNAPAGFSSYNFLLNGLSVQNSAANTFTRSNFANGDKVEVAVSNSTGCIALSNAITLTVNTLPAVAPLTGGLVICVNDSTTISSTTSGGVWSTLNPGVATVDASGLVKGIAAGTATINYLVTNSNGCDSTVKAVITVNALPTVAAITGLSNVCEGKTIALADGTAGGTWSSSDNSIATVNSSGTVTGVLAGTVTISYRVTNGNGCVKASTKVITINPLPIVTAITGTLDVCVSATTTLSSSPGGGVWTSNNKPVATVNAATGVVTGVSAGTAIITYTVTSAAGCATAVTATVTVHALPVPTITGKNPICLNDTTTYTTQAGQTNYIWSVTGGNIIAGGGLLDDTIQVDWTATGTKKITVNYTNAFGCTAATSSSFTSAPTTTPPSFVSGVSAACLNVSGNVYSTQSGFTDYTWTVTGGTIDAGGTATDNSVSITWNNTGTQSVSINYSDAFGCNADAATLYPVTVNPLPTATIAGTVTVCQNSTAPLITFTGAGGTSPYTFTYTINSGTPQTVVSTDDFATVAVNTTTPGIFTYSLVSVKDASSTTCSQAQTSSATVTVTTAPSATIAYAGSPFCTSSLPISVSQSGTSGGTFSSGAGLTINSGNGSITPASSTGGSYIITYSVPASGGCSIYTTTAPVAITTAPSASISYTGGPFCTSSSPVTVNLSGTGGGNFTSTAGLNISTGGTITPGTSTTGTYIVTYTIPAAGGCAQFTTTASVTITGAPTATISYTGSPFCTTSTAVSVNRTGTTGGTYSAGSGLTINSSTGAITPSTSTGGTYTVTYTLTGTGGCATFTTTTSVTITAAPTAAAGTAISTCSNSGTVGITTGSSANNQSGITWTTNGTGAVGNATSLTTATFTPSAADITAGSRIITLTANGNAGCAAATSTKTITINAIPATFNLTPGDTSICLGNVIPLSASIGAPVAGSQTFASSATLNLNIPDADFFGNNGSVATTLAVSGIPAGAVINSISVNFNANHTYDNDLIVNIKAPNLNVLNLINQKGGSGDNFNANISSASVTPISGTGPINGTFAPDAASGVGLPSVSNVTSFSSLTSTPNGNWILNVEDDVFHFGSGTGRINSWSITINYTTLPAPVNVVWTPSTYLYTDASLSTPYSNQSQATVYTKPTTAGTVTYTATSTNGAGCSTSKTVAVTANATPIVTITSDYCVVPNKVRLTASSVPAATSYLWSNGATTSFIDVDIAGSFDVTAFAAASCPGKATINVANELVTNGDFTLGNTGFSSDYTYKADVPGLVPAGQGELYDDSGTNGYSISTNGQNVHVSFYGQDHTANTSGTRNFMLVNGHGNTLVVWKQTVNVQPNTTYYFSAWAMSLNSAGNNATLQFSVNGTLVGNTAALTNHGETVTSPDTWQRFYGTWTSGPTTTSAVIYINDLQSALSGNDFGLDDISFGTLSTFITLESAPGTDGQTVCKGTAINNIMYSVGNGSPTGPTVSGLPAGITSSFNGSDLTISGTPTAPGGVYTYTITTSGTCNPTSVSGTITVQAPTISLSSGSVSPSACLNFSAVNTSFTLGGTATGATVTGLPTGVTATLSGTTYTISGTPTAAGSFPYTITTSGTCTPQASISGTITVEAQTVTLSSAATTAAQTVCINTGIATIRYAVGGTANNASVSGLPPGLTGTYNSGFINITGSPTSAAASPYTYTVSTSGPSCGAATVQGTVTVTPAAAITLTSAAGTNAQNACNNIAITNITYSVTNAINASVTSGALPAGVTGSFSGGVFTISGVPTVGGTFNYTVKTSGGCATATITGTIIVQAQTITLTSGAASPSPCANAPMTPIVFTLGGTATSAAVSGLPAGVTGSVSGSTFTIGGTPTAIAGNYSYTVTTSGTCDPATATGAISIQPAAVGGTLASLSTCSSTTGTLTVSGVSGTIVRWESSTDGGTTWIPIANTTITLTYNIPAPTMYRVVVGNGCGNVYSTIANISIHNYWTGTFSTDWYNAANWSDGLAPSLSCDVTIPSGTPFAAVLASGTASVANLIVKPGALFSVSGATLQIGGTLISTNGLDATNGTIVFNGTAPQNIAGSMFASNTLLNLTLSNASGLTVANTGGNLLNISGVLSFGAVNNTTLNTGNNVVLTSTATGTARVADVTNNGANTGNKFTGQVTVQRYFPSRRAWRLFTGPLSAGGNIFDNWQNGGVYQPGIGTYVSGATATSPTGANGLDWTPLNNSSLKATVALAPVVNTHTAGLSKNLTDTSDNIPYFIFVRGDRDPANADPSVSNTTTLSSKGKLQTGRQTFPASNTSLAFTFIGNPYASPVNLANIQLNNIPKRFWLWDPYINIDQGAFVSFDDILNTGTYTPSNNGTTLTQYLQSGQAFFVQTDVSGPATVTFQETSKSSVNSLVAFRPVNTIQSLRANLYDLNADTTVLLDGVLAQFDDRFNSAVDLQDAYKAGNIKETLALLRDGISLAVERRPVPVSDDTLYLHLTRTTQRSYHFEFEPTYFDPLLTAFLEDKYAGSKTALSTTAKSVYNFAINGDAVSASPDRFMITFKRSAPLPVTSKTIKAYQVAADIAVKWTVENEINITRYEVEKSVDGVNFTKVNTTTAKGAGNGVTTYSWLDVNAAVGDNFYRIRSINPTGSFDYTAVVLVKMEKLVSGIRVYPNPVTNSVIGVEFKNMAAGIYTGKLLNSAGQTVLSKTINHAPGTSMESITPDYKLASGIYQLEITAPDKEVSKIKVIFK